MKRCILYILSVLCFSMPISAAYAELPCSDYADPKDSIQFSSPILEEISGLVVSRSNSNYFWGHTDSGGKAELYLIDHNGNLVQTFAIHGISNHDWEDIAIGPCAPYESQNCIYVGDTGDNTFNRNSKRIHAIEEPVLTDDLIQDKSPKPLQVLKTWILQYPATESTEARFINPDCESLMVRPVSGEVYIISKQSNVGEQTLYQMTRGGEHAGQLTALSSYLFTSTLGQALPLYNAVTGADFTPNGYHFAIRTYAGVYEYDLTQYPDISEAFQHPAWRFSSLEIQGEAVAYDSDGKSLITAGEKKLRPAEMHPFKCVDNTSYKEPSPIQHPNPLPEQGAEPGPWLDLENHTVPADPPDPEPIPQPTPDLQPNPNPQPDPETFQLQPVYSPDCEVPPAETTSCSTRPTQTAGALPFWCFFTAIFWGMNRFSSRR